MLNICPNGVAVLAATSTRTDSAPTLALTFCLCYSTAVQLDVCLLRYLSKDLQAAKLYAVSLSRV